MWSQWNADEFRLAKIGVFVFCCISELVFAHTAFRQCEIHDSYSYVRCSTDLQANFNYVSICEFQATEDGEQGSKGS
jgi:hypothetical protein